MPSALEQTLGGIAIWLIALKYLGLGLAAGSPIYGGP